MKLAVSKLKSSLLDLSKSREATTRIRSELDLVRRDRKQIMENLNRVLRATP